MCLHRLIKENVENRYGYKLFHDYYGDIKTAYQCNNRSFEINEWVNEKDYRTDLTKDYLNIWDDDDFLYKTGFHIFQNLESARNYDKYSYMLIYLVQFKNIVAYGYQYGLKVIVAQDIKLIQEIE